MDFYYYWITVRAIPLKKQEGGGNGLFVRRGQIAMSEGVLKILVFDLGVKNCIFFCPGITRKNVQGGKIVETNVRGGKIVETNV